MPRNLIGLRIFVASPADLKEECDALGHVVEELNKVWCGQYGVVLELVTEGTHAFPAAASDPQAVINQQIGDDYDIFIGLLWARFGTPTPRAESGTEEEFDRAYARWQTNPDGVRIMFYFKTGDLSPDQIDGKQLDRVHAFRQRLGEHNLYSTFKTVDEFVHLVRVHLSRQIQAGAKSWGTSIRPTGGTVRAPVAAQETPPAVPLSPSGDEAGVIDLLEKANTESGKATEVMVHLKRGLDTMTEGIAAIQAESKKHSGGDSLAESKRSVNQMAELMQEFAADLSPDVPILRESLYNALDASSRVVSILPDWPIQSADREQLVQALEAVQGLRSAAAPHQEAMASLRAQVASIPRMTSHLNQAKRDMIEVLDAYIAAVDQALTVIPEIEGGLQSICDKPDGESQVPV